MLTYPRARASKGQQSRLQNGTCGCISEQTSLSLAGWEAWLGVLAVEMLTYLSICHWIPSVPFPLLPEQ